jgi:acetate kinase
MRVLTVNAGSTSLKLALVEDGVAETVGSYRAADAVGHRIVHGGGRFDEPIELTDDVEEAIRQASEVAPLHNGPALNALHEARAALPGIRHVAVFDSAFHSTIPDEAATYAVPARWRDEWHVRRFGFHGLSVQWVAEQVPVPRLVVCHLGGGSSVTAVRDGRSVDTSMGFSPLEGVPMQTRSGSVDPGALLWLLDGRLTREQLEHALEHESGLAALGGLDDPLGFAVFTYRVTATAAAMAAACGGLDALAFTGGVGENREDVRRRVVDRLSFLGRFSIEVVHAREELVIAREVERVLGAGS